MTEGQRVYIKTRYFEGEGTVMYVADREIYPIQVEMDEPDEDGHRVQRVKKEEIGTKPAEKKTEPVTFTGPDDPKRYEAVVVDNSRFPSLKLQEKCTLGPIMFPGVYTGGPAKNVYVYSDGKLKGCLPASIFAVSGEQTVVVVEEVEEEVELPAEAEQLSLFDFM